ncbi:hypothetical protein EVAR_98299_1 [Eumeta japonica]|uniref:Uncharacterized protein n=1 Tax=Eumeta variegata TaxID=151549 RepID=A0A4C1XB31_EUMVA|nr:hypothetical protein EVAR_98299_1 [Eumeta japonica]
MKLNLKSEIANSSFMLVCGVDKRIITSQAARRAISNEIANGYVFVVAASMIGRLLTISVGTKARAGVVSAPACRGVLARRAARRRGHEYQFAHSAGTKQSDPV